MKKSTRRLAMLILFSVLCVSLALGQQQDSLSGDLRKNAVKIFIDCRHCDIDYIREEIPYVNYVRDVREAEVYILETSQESGSGGSEYTYTFLGSGKFNGKNDTLTYSSNPDNTSDETRVGRTQMIKMGIIPYVARTPLFNEVEIGHSGNLKKEEVIDRWNYWVFEIDIDPQFEFEETRKQTEFDNSLGIYRITPEWKYEFDIDQNYELRKYIYEDTTYSRVRQSESFDGLIVKSITDHWSVGARFGIEGSTYSNLELGYGIEPAVEYNIFPYSESTRHQLRLMYSVGGNYNHYIDTTIYSKIKETLFEQKLDIAFRVQQKWGSVNLSLGGANYLHDFSKYKIELDGSIRVRVFKGLSVRVHGSAARVLNQLSLARGELDEAEILLHLKELRSEYNFDYGIGVVYTFGSIYNNIVNPRFGN